MESQAWIIVSEFCNAFPEFPRTPSLAAFWGAFMMFLFYFGNWDIAHGDINGDFAYMLVFLAVAAFGAGRILGLDAYVEQYGGDGVPLVERYPWTRYLLG